MYKAKKRRQISKNVTGEGVENLGTFADMFENRGGDLLSATAGEKVDIIFHTFFLRSKSLKMEK